MRESAVLLVCCKYTLLSVSCCLIIINRNVKTGAEFETVIFTYSLGFAAMLRINNMVN